MPTASEPMVLVAVKQWMLKHFRTMRSGGREAANQQVNAKQAKELAKLLVTAAQRGGNVNEVRVDIAYDLLQKRGMNYAREYVTYMTGMPQTEARVSSDLLPQALVEDNGL